MGERERPSGRSEDGRGEGETESEVVGIRTDSSERMIQFGTGGPVGGDSLGDGAYVLRYDGRADTLGLPRMEDRVREMETPESLDEPNSPSSDPTSDEGQAAEPRFAQGRAVRTASDART